jgi:hypothetical protein
VPDSADCEGADPFGFDAWSAEQGFFTNTADQAHSGSAACLAHKNPTVADSVAYARGEFQLDSARWTRGDEVVYAAWFRIPTSFYSNQRGDVGILRWEHFEGAGPCPTVHAKKGGISIGRPPASTLRLFRFTDCTPGNETLLETGYRVPPDLWTLVWVRQRLDTVPGCSNGGCRGAFSQVLVINSQEAFAWETTAPNWYDAADVNRLRVGLTHAEMESPFANTEPLELYVDDAHVCAWSPRGPLKRGKKKGDSAVKFLAKTVLKGKDCDRKRGRATTD